MGETQNDGSQQDTRTVVQPTPSKYQTLHERGVELTDSQIDYIVNLLTEGMSDVKHFLDCDNDPDIGFICSDDMTGIGYVPEQRTINIPLQFFKNLYQYAQPFEDYIVHIGVADKANITTTPIPFAQYLVAVGREELVHHYQAIGHPLLQVSPPDITSYKQLSAVDQLLCDYEVEARRIVDSISKNKGQPPIWEKIDSQLQVIYPQRYNKPVAQLHGSTR